MKRRVITKPDSHWEEKIIKELTGNKVTWGCLNQKYELFGHRFPLLTLYRDQHLFLDL